MTGFSASGISEIEALSVRRSDDIIRRNKNRVVNGMQVRQGRRTNPRFENLDSRISAKFDWVFAYRRLMVDQVYEQVFGVRSGRHDIHPVH